MSLPTSTNDVTARKLSSVIDGLWTKIKSTFVKKAGDTMSGRLTLQKPLTQLITGTGTAAVTTSPYYPARWKFNLGIATPTAGDRLVIQLPCAGHDNGCFMSTDNGTTYYPVARNTGTSRLTTHYPSGSYVCVVFESYVSGNNNAGRVDSVYPPTGGTDRQNYTIGCWRVINDYDANSNTIPSAYCETAAGTAAKAASCTTYTATANTYLHVLIRYANTSAGALTLNVNGQGAKPIYINGAVSSATNYTLPAGTYIAFYDGTNYWLRTDGRIEGKVTGTAGFADAVYNRSNNDGDGWYKIAESSLAPRTNSDVTAAWDVFRCTAGGGLFVEKLTLDVRFNASGDGVVSRFYRTDEFDSTASLKFAVLVSGQGGSGNTQVQLWAYLSKAWQSVSIHQDAGSNWSLQKYNTTWSYYSATTGGTSKPVADSTNHISVTDSTNLYTRDASMIASGTLPVSRGGTGMSTATNVNSVVIGNSTTATSAMQTVRTGNGAFYATAQDAKPTFGTLPVAQGGTSKTTAVDACNLFINALSTGSSTPTDNDYYVSQYVGGGTTTTTYHRRPMSAMWTWIKGKLTPDTGVNISGNAATASAAQSGSALETAINGKSPTNHAHGNITNGGAITASGVALASGDSLAFVDSSDSSKVKKTSITFDGSTAGKALTQKGTFESVMLQADAMGVSGGSGVDITYSGSTATIAANIPSIPVATIEALSL